MFIVKRSFRNYGQIIAPGSVVEPGAIKRFKAHLNDRRIIEVNEHNFKEWQKYFKVRCNIDIPLIKKGVEHVEIKEKAEEVKEKATEVKQKTREVKPAVASVKATVK